MSKKICMVLVFLLTMAGMLSAQTRTVKGNVDLPWKRLTLLGG